MTAPRATVSSGCCEMSGSREKISATSRRTRGMRVLPPTRTTALRSAGFSFASLSAMRQWPRVRSMMRRATCSNSARVTVLTKLSAPRRKGICTATSSCDESACLASMAASCSRARASGLHSPPACAANQPARARSMSSPPSAVSPCVASTWKMPSFISRMEMSNVPPPRS